MKKIEVSNTFKKNYKKIDKKYRSKLDNYTSTLVSGEPLPPAARDHALNGRMKDYRSFKLDNNLRVIYQLFKDTLYFIDIGTHGVYESLKEKLSTYMKTTEQLNPLLFEGETLKPEIKDKILEIVDAFLEYAEVDINVMDIRLVGSNAAYNYNEYSDLDIHIVTDLSKVSDPETIARLYFDSVKSNFNKSYDIKIKGIDVELYVEDINSSSASNGIYSVKKDAWIKEPTPTVAPTDEELAAAEEMEEEILDSIASVSSIEELQDILNNLYLLRKDSLSAHGETGAGNLAFKSLRNSGILDKIKDTLKSAKAKELSLESKSLEESRELKTLKGSSIKRSTKYGVGKEIGGQIYFHKNYVDRVCPELYAVALEMLHRGYPEFEFNCLMYDKKKPETLRFDSAPDFDTAREPSPGQMVAVDVSTRTLTKLSSRQIWHHKWLWVMDDYTGFDVEESYQWSQKWLEKITSPSGYPERWESALKSAGLDEDKEWLGGNPWDDDLFHTSAEKLGLDVGQEDIKLGDKSLEFDYVILKSPTIFYHATTKDRVDKIREEGLRPQPQAGGKYVSGVFLAGSKDSLSKWRGDATVVLKVLLPSRTKVYQDRQSNAVFVREAIPASNIS